MNLDTYLSTLKSAPSSINFEDTISTIDEHYVFTATLFNNADLSNPAGQNNGSCKIFAFAQLHDLTEEQTLHCFGGYYRKDVLQNPDANDHQNIRNFIKTGWHGIVFDSPALNLKSASK
ncbi:Type III effector HopPmaJ [hydrothermal vent metagenome]|uniref:Type III effector HopPmaJ n=1 Tax=hydrothermal vent metagenome TaxID=652676 RepID=A0A3B0Y3Y0_9ZZZZ